MTKEGWAELLTQTNSRGTTWLAWCKAKNMLELTENTSKWDPYMVASFVRQREAWRNEEGEHPAPPARKSFGELFGVGPAQCKALIDEPSTRVHQAIRREWQRTFPAIPEVSAEVFRSLYLCTPRSPDDPNGKRDPSDT